MTEPQLRPFPEVFIATTVLINGNGSLASPSIAFAASSDRGIYNDTTNNRVGIAEGLSLPGGQLVLTALDNVGTPTITPQGTTGATTYGYKIVATNGAGVTAASTEGTTATGNATLSSSNFNRITWTAVTGATGYKVYRTTGAATQGLISTITSGSTVTLDDTGLVGGGETAETVNTTSYVGIGAVPTEHLSIEGAGNQALSIYSTDTGIVDTPKTFIKLFGENTGGTKTEQARISSSPGETLSTAGQLILSTNNSSNVLTERARINENGFVGIARTPTTLFDILGADNTTIQTVQVNAVQASVTAADTFIDFRSNTGSEGSIAGTAAAGVIAYNTFTGSHWTQIEDKTGLEVGMLLEIIDGKPIFEKRLKLAEHTIEVDSGKKDKSGKPIMETRVVPDEFYEASNKEHLFKTRISKTRRSKAAIGVYVGTDKESRDMAASIGTGICLLANKGVNLEIGDYLMSSDVAGHMERQADDVYHNYTVAKITQSVAWKLGEKTRQVKCIYEGG